MRKLAVAAVSILLLAGCSGADLNGPELSAEPVRGGVLRQGLVNVVSIDPAKASTVSERVLADQLFDTLTVWDPSNGSVRPQLAEKWEASNANKTWTFTLRADAKAVNGEPITATDVKRTLEQTVSPPSVMGDLLAPVVGYAEAAANPAVGLAGITTPDVRTVKIELAAPVAELPSLLGNPGFGIKHYLAPASAEAPPTATGTGPFAIASEVPGQSMVLTRADGGSAYLDRIDVSFFADLDLAYQAFERGELDWVPVAPTRAVEAARKYGAHLFRPSLRTLYLSINTKNPKYADPRFRQAIIRAIDRPAAVRVTQGEVRFLNAVNSEAVPEEERALCGVSCSYDPEASKKLLAELFPGGTPPPVVIDIVAGPPFVDNVRNRIVGDLAAVGITADVRSAPADQFGSVTVTDQREVIQTGWSAAYPSAEAAIPALFSSTSPANVSGFSDPEIDRRIAEAQAETDETRRALLFSRLEADILSRVPVIPLMQFPVGSVAVPSVRGISVQPTGNFDASAVWIRPTSP